MLNSVSIATGCGLDGRVLVSGKAKRSISTPPRPDGYEDVRAPGNWDV
jgi:hypothetical protein